jgi:two-component system nitrate/nitrite response regulator NarL
MSAASPGPALLPVVIIEDHPLFSDGLRRMLESGGRVGPVRCAAGQAEALRMASEGPEPGVFVVDLHLREGSGLSLIPQLRARWPAAACVVVTASESAEMHEAARAVGAAAVVAKSAAPHEIRAKIEAFAGPAPSGSPLEALTIREREVLRLIGQGLTTRELADALCVSPKTIETHRVNLKKKLGVDDVYKLVLLAAEHG